MNNYEKQELLDFAEELAQIPHPMAEELLGSFMAFIKENGE